MSIKKPQTLKIFGEFLPLATGVFFYSTAGQILLALASFRVCVRHEAYFPEIVKASTVFPMVLLDPYRDR